MQERKGGHKVCRTVVPDHTTAQTCCHHCFVLSVDQSSLGKKVFWCGQTCSESGGGMERMASDSSGFLGRMGIILRGWCLPRPVWLLKTVWSASLQFSDETAFCSLLYPQSIPKLLSVGKQFLHLSISLTSCTDMKLAAS